LPQFAAAVLDQITPITTSSALTFLDSQLSTINSRRGRLSNYRKPLTMDETCDESCRSADSTSALSFVAPQLPAPSSLPKTAWALGLYAALSS